MKKKIAVLLPGMPRNLDKVYQNQLNFFSHPDYDIDFFIHSWNSISYSVHLKETLGSDTDYVDSTKLSNKLKLYYNTDHVVVEDQRNHKIIDNVCKTLVHISTIITEEKRLRAKHIAKKISDAELHIHQLYGIQQCCKMKAEHEIKNNFEYDYVWKARLDLFFYNDKNQKDAFKETLDHCDKKHNEFKWYSRHDWKPNKLGDILVKWMQSKRGYSYIADMVYLAKSKVIDGLCLDLFEYFTELAIRDMIDNYLEFKLVPEYVLGLKFRRDCIDAEPINYPICMPYRPYHNNIDNNNWQEMAKAYHSEGDFRKTDIELDK